MVSFTNITLADNRTWVFTWTDTGADYYRIVLDGAEIDQTTDPTYTFTLPGYEDFPPPIEVVEETEVALSEQNLPYLVMQWYQVADAEYYRIDEFLDSVWVQREIVQETSLWVYTLRTPVLVDGDSYQYRVVAVSSVGDESTELDFVIRIVCPPRHLDNAVVIGYDDPTTSITVTAGS